jgi:hypothetical protein
LEADLNQFDSTAVPHRVPFARFFAWTVVQSFGAIALYAIVAPHALAAELLSPWKILLWTFALGLPLSLFEYLYHRYLLHSAVLPFLGAMHRAHGLHHRLTSIKAPVRADEPARLVEVRSEFPVEHEHQEEAMMFPAYSVTAFNALFLILLALPLKLLFPTSPTIIAVLIAVPLYYVWYEMSHAVFHLPFERYWLPWMRSRWIGRTVRRVYGFHLMHHWRPSANLAIVGFWGVALWDYAFRTHRRPERLPVHKAEVAYTDAILKRPAWPVSMLDQWQGSWYRVSRRIEKLVAHLVLRRHRTSQ